MTERMYSERKGNIPAFRGCRFGCSYCAFKRLVQMNKKCPDCAEFEPHYHPEALNKTPPKTKEGEFLTVGLSGDISYANDDEWTRILSYCRHWDTRTFLIQSKDPACFLYKWVPDNVIVGTTIESDCDVWYSTASTVLMRSVTHYNDISKAPLPHCRYTAMQELTCRKAVTIEPIFDFDLEILSDWIKKIKPEIIWIGYDSGNNKLPEPSLLKTRQLITDLRTHGLDVKEKLLRKAWWEGV